MKIAKKFKLFLWFSKAKSRLLFHTFGACSPSAGFQVERSFWICFQSGSFREEAAKFFGK